MVLLKRQGLLRSLPVSLSSVAVAAVVAGHMNPYAI